MDSEELTSPVELNQDPESVFLGAALEYASRGWAVLPLHSVVGGSCTCTKAGECGSAGKHPRTKNGLKDATTDCEVIRRWWAKWPAANVGIITGRASGIVVLDLDEGGEEALAALCAQMGELSKTVEAMTGSGGRHLYFSAPEVAVSNSARKLGPGLDVRGDGGYVVAPPSVHKTGRAYAWSEGHGPGAVTTVEMPHWLVELATTTDARVEEGGSDARIPKGTRDDTLFRRGCALVRQGLSPDAVLAALKAENEAKCEPPLTEREVQNAARSAERYRKTTGESSDAPVVGDDVPLDAPDSDQPEGAVVLVLHPERQNPVTANMYSSVCRLLRAEAKAMLGGRLRWNEMLLAATINGKELSPSDRSRIHERIEAICPVKDGYSRSFIDWAVDQIAQESSFHPVRDYLRSLRWDGTPRIAEVLRDVLDSDAPAIASTVIRKWMVSAVARALKPGCKVDTVLILAGPQGAGKSSFFEALASEEWFSDSTIDIHNKDAYMSLARAWIVEFPELESMQRARDMDSVKAFLSSRVDAYRPPYGRVVMKVPRSCVIVGTTNQDTFLTDPTGNRRYWPVTVGPKIDLARLRADRDQLWAEATMAYGDGVTGERWWLTDDEERELARMRGHFEVFDAWEDLVGKYLRSRTDPFTTADVLTDAIEKKPGQWNRADEMRVAAILKKRGVVQKRVGEQRTRLWIPVGRQPATRAAAKGNWSTHPDSRDVPGAP